jgi:hypothetical protein
LRAHGVVHSPSTSGAARTGLPPLASSGFFVLSSIFIPAHGVGKVNSCSSPRADLHSCVGWCKIFGPPCAPGAEIVAVRDAGEEDDLLSPPPPCTPDTFLWCRYLVVAGSGFCRRGWIWERGGVGGDGCARGLVSALCSAFTALGPLLHLSASLCIRSRVFSLALVLRPRNIASPSARRRDLAWRRSEGRGCRRRVKRGSAPCCRDYHVGLFLGSRRDIC